LWLWLELGSLSAIWFRFAIQQVNRACDGTLWRIDEHRFDDSFPAKHYSPSHVQLLGHCARLPRSISATTVEHQRIVAVEMLVGAISGVGDRGSQLVPGFGVASAKHHGRGVLVGRGVDCGRRVGVAVGVSWASR